MSTVRVGLAATKGAWSQALRAYVRDHGQGVELEVVLDEKALRRALPSMDVLIVDDVMRTFSFPEVARARDSGVFVIGICDAAAGLGRQHLLALGAEEVFPASTSPSQLVARLAQVPPRLASAPKCPPPPPLASTSAVHVRAAARCSRGQVTAWTKVNGGAGLTELVLGAAEHLSRKGNTLLIEAEELSPVMLSRLSRSTEGGLPWALARARQGLPAVREALSAPRDETGNRVGHFDVLCAGTGQVQGISPSQLEAVIDEAATAYEHVLVETSWLLPPATNRERFAATRSCLQRAGAIVVVASADPEGAARLVHWRAAAVAAEVTAPCCAVFGRSPDNRYQQDQLVSLVDANTGRHPFECFGFLPEDPAVPRARWNAQIACKGAWAKAVQDLAKLVSSAAPEPLRREPVLGDAPFTMAQRLPAGAHI